MTHTQTLVVSGSDNRDNTKWHTLGFLPFSSNKCKGDRNENDFTKNEELKLKLEEASAKHWFRHHYSHQLSLTQQFCYDKTSRAHPTGIVKYSRRLFRFSHHYISGWGLTVYF